MDFLNRCREEQKRYAKMNERNIKDACYEMVAKAKEVTPPPPGAVRGKNTTTGDMAAHWTFDIRTVKDMHRVKLENGVYQIYEKANGQKVEVHYASYVENGHKVDKHFVPWLRVDDTGMALERVIPEPGEKMFGIMVGTKTKEVPAANIVEKAQKRFFDAYKLMYNQTINQTDDRLNK